MIDRIYLGKVPNYFTGIYNLLHKWKYFIWVSARKLRFNRKYAKVPIFQFEKIYRIVRMLGLLQDTRPTYRSDELQTQGNHSH